MASTAGQGWAQLRQQARSLESQVWSHEGRETRRSRVTDRPADRSIPPNILAVLDANSHPAKADRRRKKCRGQGPGTARQGKQACASSSSSKPHQLTPNPPPQRESVIAQLGRLLDSEATLTSSALKQNNLSLLRDKLTDHRRDLTRLRNTLSGARDRANLLGSVRDDISAYRAANPAAAEAEYMLDERARVDRSHDAADSVLSQAYAVQEGFALQRETLASINRRITLAASQVPGINTLIGRISAKKRRDGIIMGSFIAVCFLMFWFFM